MPFSEGFTDCQNPYNNAQNANLSMVLEKMSLWNSNKNSQKPSYLIDNHGPPTNHRDHSSFYRSKLQTNHIDSKKRIWISGYGLVDL